MLMAEQSTIKPLGKRVVVRPVPKEKERSGIILQDDLQKQKGEGTVIAVGKEVKSVHIGDKILFSPLYYDEIDQEHFIIEEEDIWAIVQ